MSFMKIANKMGDKQETWGTPDEIRCEVDRELFNRTLKSLFERNDLIM